MGRKSTVTDKSNARYVRITDEDIWQKIDKLMELDCYKTSMNQLLNDAIKIGVPELYVKHFTESEIDGEMKPIEIPVVFQEGSRDYYLVRLMKEMIALLSTNKSLLSSMFNASLETLKGRNANADRFERGGYGSTPYYIIPQEARMLKEANKK